MTNPSIEYMRQIRREEQAKLLDMRRERVVKTLRSLDLHGGSHAMLSQIAYSIHPHVGAWDVESCDHLRNVLAELIGDAREAKSDAQHHCACGAGGCGCGDESAEVETERHEAVCELRKLGKCSPLAHNFRDAIAAAVAVPKDGAPYDDGELCHLICDRLIHLLGGDQSHDTSPMGLKSETGITDKPDDDERYVLDTSKATTIGYEPDGLVVKNGEHEVRITNGDTIIDGISVVAALDEVASGRLPEFARSNPVVVDYMQREIMELRKVRDELLDLLRDARDEYKMLDRMSAETSANFHAMRDRVWGLEAGRDELNTQLDNKLEQCQRYRRHIDRMQGGSKRLREKLREQEGMYLDLLRDAARDYKAMQNKLNLVFDMWANATISKETLNE